MMTHAPRALFPGAPPRAPPGASPRPRPPMNLSLFERDVTVATLASGSKGNCTYIGDGHAGVLIDCGVSTRQILRRMDEVGLGDAPIDAVLITHEHSDHVGAARILCNKLRKRTGRSVPFFMTEGTRRGVRERCMPDAIEVIRPHETIQVRHLTLDPFSVPHDTHDPVGWRVCVGGTWAGVISDLGRPTALVAEKLRSLEIAVVEFNHDPDMLMAGSYPWQLKQRIRSSHGHLSNAQAAELVVQGLSDNLRHLVLAHLSGENNTPAKALTAATDALREAGALGQVDVQVAAQDTPTRPVRVRARAW